MIAIVVWMLRNRGMSRSTLLTPDIEKLYKGVLIKLSRLLIIVVMSTLCVSSVSALDDELTQKKNARNKFRGRRNLLAQSLVFSEVFTWITDVKTQEGLPDYPAAVNRHFGKDVSSEKNGAVALYEAFGPAPEGARLSDKFFELLEMPVPPDAGKYFQHFGAGLSVEKRRKLNDRYSESWRQPWAEKVFPEVAQWLRDNEKPVETIVKGAMLPEYYSPLVPPVDAEVHPGGLITTLLPGIQKSRSIARYLVSRAMLNIEKGNVEYAWRDLIACHRVGEMIGRGPTLIEYLVGAAITQIATHGQIVFLDRVQPAVAQLAQYRKDLSNLRPIKPAVEQVVFTERMMYLDSVVQIACECIDFIDLVASPASGFEEFETQLGMLPIDWNIVMREGNRIYDRFDAAMKLKSYQDRRAAIAKIEGDLKLVRAKVSVKGFLLAAVMEESTSEAISKMVGNVLSASLVPTLSGVNQAYNRSVQTRENLLLAFAIVDWKEQHDSYPAMLNDLVPDFVSESPTDSFSETPLSYRREGNGFIFYSVGVNEIDDNGRSYDDEPKGDDLFIRLPLPEPKSKE